MTAQTPAPMLASVSARSRRGPWRSDRTACVTVSMVVPAKPMAAAPASVGTTVSVSVKSAAPAVASNAEDQSSGPRRKRRVALANTAPASAAPADQRAE